MNEYGYKRITGQGLKGEGIFKHYDKMYDLQ